MYFGPSESETQPHNVVADTDGVFQVGTKTSIGVASSIGKNGKLLREVIRPTQ